MSTSTRTIEWRDHHSLDETLVEATATGKPVLLDLFSPSCQGCSRLEAETYSDPQVIDLVARSVIPLRVTTDTDGPDDKVSAIVGRHIFIWSPTIQLVDGNETILHEFSGAPRHTRMDVGYSRVHHEVPGNLTSRGFLAQLELGLAKAAMKDGARLPEAFHRLEGVLARFPDDHDAVEEARFWRESLLAMDGEAPAKLRAFTPASPLAGAVHAYCEILLRVAPDELMKDWHGTPGPGPWMKYSDCLREIVFGTYQSLIDLALEIQHERAREGPGVTLAQRLLAQHQMAYRALQSVLLGVPDSALDRAPFARERTVRDHLLHCVMAEYWAHSAQIRQGIANARAGTGPAPVPSRAILEGYGEPPRAYGALSDLQMQYEVLHDAVVDEFADVSDDELRAPTIWWEDQPIDVAFRLARLGWHLRDHAVSVERILTGLGRKTNDMHGLCRLLFEALGQAEGVMIGAVGRFEERAVALASTIEARIPEIAELAVLDVDGSSLQRVPPR